MDTRLSLARVGLAHPSEVSSGVPPSARASGAAASAPLARALPCHFAVCALRCPSVCPSVAFVCSVLQLPCLRIPCCSTLQRAAPLRARGTARRDPPHGRVGGHGAGQDRERRLGGLPQRGGGERGRAGRRARRRARRQRPRPRPRPRRPRRARARARARTSASAPGTQVRGVGATPRECVAVRKEGPAPPAPSVRAGRGARGARVGTHARKCVGARTPPLLPRTGASACVRESGTCACPPCRAVPCPARGRGTGCQTGPCHSLLLRPCLAGHSHTRARAAQSPG